MSSDKVPVVTVPVTIKQLATIFECRVQELLAVLSFQLKRNNMSIHSELGAEDVKDVVRVMGKRVRLVVPDQS